MAERPKDSYTLVHCNLNRANTVDSWEGSLPYSRCGIDSLWGLVLLWESRFGATGTQAAFSRDQLDQALTSSGIHILDDQCMEIPGVLTIAGRHDAAISGQGPRLPLTQLLSQANPDLPFILVDHQPLEQQQAIESGVLLHLSGHTHGGQVWPANWLAPLLMPHRLFYGCRQIGSGYAVVSSGLGNRGSRLRSGCSAEMVCIELNCIP